MINNENITIDELNKSDLDLKNYFTALDVMTELQGGVQHRSFLPDEPSAETSEFVAYLEKEMSEILSLSEEVKEAGLQI